MQNRFGCNRVLCITQLSESHDSPFAIQCISITLWDKVVRQWFTICTVAYNWNPHFQRLCCGSFSVRHLDLCEYSSSFCWWWVRLPGVVWVECWNLLKMCTESCPVFWGYFEWTPTLTTPGDLYHHHLGLLLFRFGQIWDHAPYLVRASSWLMKVRRLCIPVIKIYCHWDISMHESTACAVWTVHFENASDSIQSCLAFHHASVLTLGLSSCDNDECMS